MVTLIQTRNRERGPVAIRSPYLLRAQRFSLLLHGVVAALCCWFPGRSSYTPIRLLLLSLVVFDCARSQRRIHARRGTETAHRFPSSLAKRRMEILGTPWVIR